MRNWLKSLASFSLAFIVGAGIANAAPIYQRLQQLIASGTAAAPAVGFIADIDTGPYRAAADTYGIAGGGAAAMTVTPGTLAMKKSSTTNTITSDTTATAMTSSVAAVTVAPTATPAANDLVFEVNDAAGTSLFSVDNEGDVIFAGANSFTDLTLSGNDLTGSGTGQSFNIVSGTNDATTSSTVAALTLSASVNITAGDLVLEVNDSAANSLMSVDEQGKLVCLSDVSFAGGDLLSTHATQSLNITSATNDATTSSTVAAITLAPTVDVTSGDLVLEVNDSAAASLMTLDEQGKMVVLSTLAIGGGSAISKFISTTTGALDIGSAAANTAVTVTQAVTDATLGDLCMVAPLEDDAAWDEGSLTCFVESSAVVKIVYHADATGADPGASNTYKILLVRY